MKITIQSFRGGAYDGNFCYVHARACAVGRENLILTMQHLNVKKSDVFSPLVVCRSNDGGASWSAPEPDPAFEVISDGGSIRKVGCDATHLYHKKTDTPLVVGVMATYEADAYEPSHTLGNKSFYSVYDQKTGKYSPIRPIAIPEQVPFTSCAPGCAQFCEKEDGDILIPVHCNEEGRTQFTTFVLTCSFDGENLVCKRISNPLRYDVARGAYEPSVCCYRGKYYLTLRNDECGMYSVSEDGELFSEPEIWKWDTEKDLPNYNTQQHWLQCGGKLYLVYTRRAGNNDHVFRHRAPLFMAEVDVERMRILRQTEQIVVPERGARLGNFGVTQVNDNLAYVTVCEWMQPAGCEKYGSDNSVYVTKVEA